MILFNLIKTNQIAIHSFVSRLLTVPSFRTRRPVQAYKPLTHRLKIQNVNQIVTTLIGCFRIVCPLLRSLASTLFVIGQVGF